MIEPGEELLVMKNLLRRGIVRPVRKHELLTYHEQPVLNGFFGVTKGGAADDAS